MDPRLEANRANWNSRVAVHVQSRFYNVDGWLASSTGPPSREVDLLGDVSGLRLVHLQCHFGMDTLCWARVGATVTGVDFSPEAVAEASLLAERAGLSHRASFICSNLYNAPSALSHEKFDVVYVSLGSLCWLPDIAGWAKVVRDLLSPSGRLFLHDVHPMTMCLDNEGDRMVYGYFEERDAPLVYDDDSTYTDGGPLEVVRTYEWNHSIGEIVTALRENGLAIDSLDEHDWTLFQQFPWLVESGSGHLIIPESRPRFPLSYTLMARAPA